MNRKTNLVIVVFIFALMFASLVYADSITSVTTSTSVSTATTGTSVSITSVSTADSGTVTASRIEVVSSGASTGGSFTISDPSTGYYSSVPVSSSGTTKTFTITAGTTDTYTYSVRATYSSGSKSSTDSILEFVNPSALTVSGSPSATNKAKSESFTLSISIQNSQSSAITTSYSLSYDSTYFTVSGDPTSSTGTTINAGTTTTLQWTVTESTAYSGSKTITFTLGDNSNAFTTTVTNDPTCSDSVQNGNETGTDCGGSCNTCSTGDTSTGGGGGGAGGVSESVAYTSNKASISYSSISENSTKIIRFANTSATDLKNITFKAVNRITNMELNIYKLTSKPSGVTTPTGNAYRYIQIDEANVTDANITDVKINFFVEKSWFTDNNYDYTTTKLHRYKDGAWAALATTKSWEDATYYYFEAGSPGLSVFVITAEAAAPAEEEITEPTAPAEPVCGNGVVEGSEQCEKDSDITDTCVSRGFTGGTLKCTNCRVDESQCTMETLFGETTKETMDYTIYMIIAILIVIIIAGYFYYHGHRHF